MINIDSGETLVATTRFEQRGDHSTRECGLIDPKYKASFEVPPADDEELVLFDELCGKSDGGWVYFRNNMLRLDHNMENGNEIRSIIESKVHEDGTLHFVTTNLICHRDGRYYLEIHPGFVDENGDIWEPPVGGPDVSPAPHSALVIHYQVAYEAQPVTTLPEAA